MKIVINQQKVLAFIGIAAFATLLIFCTISSVQHGVKGNPAALIAFILYVFIACVLLMILGKLIHDIAVGKIVLFKPIEIDTAAKKKKFEEHKAEVIRLLNADKQEEAEELIRKFINKK